MEAPTPTTRAPAVLAAPTRQRVLQFLMSASMRLGVAPIVKYTALSLFADRFLPPLLRLLGENAAQSWLLQPLRESNLQLFTLISLWISSKLHDTCPLSSKSLKALGDRHIKDQHFTLRDFVEAELVFMEVLRFEIGALNVAFTFLEELLIQFRELFRLGELVSFHACMDIMDLLYETEETSKLYSQPCPLAASVLIAAYVLTVNKQQWELPLLPWVKFATPYEEEHIGQLVRRILEHVLMPTALKCKTSSAVVP